MAKDDADAWAGLSGRTRNLFLTKQGVETGALPVMLHVKACTGWVALGGVLLLWGYALAALVALLLGWALFWGPSQTQ